MSQYTIKYACGHGSTTKNLTGKVSERERYVEWAESTLVCPDCFKAKKAAEDASAPRLAKITLVPAAEPIIAIEISGQIETNKESLYGLGYHWSDSTAGGLMGYFSTQRPTRVLAKIHKIQGADAVAAWINEQAAELTPLGYAIKDGLSALDMAYIAKLCADKNDKEDAKAAAKARLAEIKANDPRPEISPLRKRIAEIEAKTGKKWNSKIYGKAGRYNFYVADNQYSATDAEVSEREAINKAIDAWDAKYKAEIEAAK